jgi:hypothetical protein
LLFLSAGRWGRENGFFCTFFFGLGFGFEAFEKFALRSEGERTVG